jgi:hypothetical protein
MAGGRGNTDFMKRSVRLLWVDKEAIRARLPFESSGRVTGVGDGKFKRLVQYDAKTFRLWNGYKWAVRQSHREKIRER